MAHDHHSQTYFHLLITTPRYMVAGGVGYAYIGTAVLINGDPLTSDLAPGPALKTVNSFLAVHVMIAYVIEGNVLARGILKMLGMDKTVTGNGAKDRLTWLAVTAAIVFGAFTLSNLVPFFSDLMGLLGAMCSILLSYTIPFAASLFLLPMGERERCFVRSFIPFSLLVALLGTICSVADITGKLAGDSKAPPFSC